MTWLQHPHALPQFHRVLHLAVHVELEPFGWLGN